MGPDLNVFNMFPELLMAFADHSLVLTDTHGRIRDGYEGFYLHQTRFLSKLDFRIDGETPSFVSANPVDTYSFISYYLARAPIGREASPDADDPDADGGEVIEKGIELQIDRFVGSGLHQDLILTNWTFKPVTITLELLMQADFADLVDAIEETSRQSAPVCCEFKSGETSCELLFRYEHPALDHATAVTFPCRPVRPRFEDGKVVYRLTLEPRTPVRLCIDVYPIFLGERHTPKYDCTSFHSHDTVADQLRDRWTEESAKLVTGVPHVQLAWNRAVSDLGALALLDGEGDQRFLPAAGIPIYQALFGRDTLTAAWQAGMANPAMLRGTVECLVRYMGAKYDARYDEQPGKIIHQRQRSPLSLLGMNPYLHYYGDYAAAPMFLVCIAWYYAMTGNKAWVRELKEPILRCLTWMDRDGDVDGDGFYEYKTRAGRWGTKNQGWKDSDQAILYPDGRNVDDPIATVELQGYFYAAKQLIGLTFLMLGEWALGSELLAQAQALKRRFNERFWLPEQGFYALALDPDKKPIATIASNAGHCLSCGIVDADKARMLGGRLMAPDLFSGWGIRTLSNQHPAFNPFLYHLGTVWPSENASICLGLRRYGLDDLALDLAKALFDATTVFNYYRLPEAIGGHQRDRWHPHPGIYPKSCAPQAWSASAIVSLIQSLLGFVPLAPLGLLVVDPILPEWLPELELKDLCIGAGSVDLHFKRDAHGHTDFRVTRRTGSLHVLRQPAPESQAAGWGDRLSALVGSLIHR